MEYVVKTLGIIFLAVGVLGAASPALVRAIINFAKVGKRIYIGGVVRIVFGLLLLLAIKNVTFPWVTGAIGALFIIGGALIFILNLQKTHEFMDKFLMWPDNKLRMLLCLPVLIGALLIYSV